MKSLIRRMMITAALMCAAQVSAQTAADPGEGLRATVGTTSGTTAISWWGKAGRSYFVQTCETLMEEDWRYVPVVEAGTEAVITWNLSSTAQRAFVRLIYTDQIYTGPVADADFDGDGLSNALEVAVGWGTDPFIADTDGDGFNDKLEHTRGSSGTDGAATPMSINSNYISMIRSYEAQKLTASDSYNMWRNKNNQGAWNDWVWGQNWHQPGSFGTDGGTSSSKPSPTFHGYPFDALYSNDHWTEVGFYFQKFQPYAYIETQLDFYPAAQEVVSNLNFESYESENGFQVCEWQRYRIHLSDALPFDYSETFITVRYEYEENPEYLAGSGPTKDYRWKRITADSGISEVDSFTLTVLAGQHDSGWEEVYPTVAAPGHYAVVQVAPVSMTLRANPLALWPPLPGTTFTPSPENTAFDNIVPNIGVNQLGKLSMGMGRAGEPGGVGNAFCAPVEVYADVPDIPNITWEWQRHVKSKSWKIRVVQATPGGPTELVATLLGELNTPDHPEPVSCDVTRSSNGRIYTADSSGVSLSDVNGSLNVGDFFYMERQFEYWLKGTANGTTFETARMNVAQKISMRRIRQSSPLAGDFTGFDNYNVVGETDLELTQPEVTALVKGQPINP